jgi:methylenetetrahydrofolate dehydrogenase (NADP+)/methenyltetrahydrofolate cyclohydrolase
MLNQKLFFYFNNLGTQSIEFDLWVIFFTDWMGWWLIGGAIFFGIVRSVVKDKSLKICFFSYRESIKRLVIIFGSTLSVWSIAQIIKYFYYSPRPFLVLEDINLFFIHGGNDSFPSGHTVFYISLATIIYFYNKKWGITYGVLAILIGLSRVVAGVHWPYDILGGIVFGFVGSFLIGRKLFSKSGIAPLNLLKSDPKGLGRSGKALNQRSGKAVNGREIASDLKKKLKNQIAVLNRKPRLALFLVGDDYATSKFVNAKQKFAKDINIEIKIFKYPADVASGVFKNDIGQKMIKFDGVVVQLPLPSHINTQEILNTIPVDKDVDVLSEKSLELFKQNNLNILPPVIGAIKEIISRHRVSTKDLKDKKVVIIGKGRLVGLPAKFWFENLGSQVTVVDSKTIDISEKTKQADIIVTGAGVPDLITSDMIKDGVMIFDAGTSKSEGKLIGDVCKDCARKAKFVTPVVGGIGPITVAILFKNLIKNHQI